MIIKKIDIHTILNNYSYLDKFIQKIEPFKHHFRLVGGSVRDFLLGYNPHDIDLTTNLHPQQLITILDQAHIKYIDKNINYGTIIVIIDKNIIDITSLRKDINHQGREAKVVFCKDWKIDANRRDLTINALYLDFNGNIYDYHFGINDLHNNLIKLIGSPIQRIKEDHLRIMRLFRFALYFGLTNQKINSQSYNFVDFNIDHQSLYVSTKYAYLIKNLSPFRIKDELFKILSTKDFISLYHLFKYLQLNRIIRYIIPMNVEYSVFNMLGSFIIKQKIDIVTLDKFFTYITPIHKLALLVDNKMFNIDGKDSNNDHNNDLSQILSTVNICLYLSSKEKKLLKILTNIGNLGLTVNDFESMDINIQHKKNLTIYNKNLYIDIIIYIFLKHIIHNNHLNFNVFNIINLINLISAINNFILPKFPINGNDLKNLNIEPNVIFGRIIAKAKLYWAETDFSINKKELLRYIQSQIGIS